MSELRKIPLTEIEAMTDGEAIPALAGKIKDVYDRKTGESEYGEWSFQDASLFHGDTLVRLKAANLPDLSDLKGKSVVIECSQSKRHGLTGVTKLVDQYQGKTYHKVKLTGSCKIREVNGAEEEDEIPGIKPVNPTINQCSESVGKAREELARAANGMLLCMDAARHVLMTYQEKYEGVEVTPEHFQALCATLFIHLDRSGKLAGLPLAPIYPRKKD